MNKHVFVDMDGVLTTFGSENGTVTIGNWNRDGLFLNRKPVTQMIELLFEMYREDTLYILSAAPHQKAIMEKHAWLNIHFPIPLENRIFVGHPQADKGKVLHEWSKANMIDPKDIILIDDTHKFLFSAESYGFKVYHPSTILTMKYAVGRSKAIKMIRDKLEDKSSKGKYFKKEDLKTILYFLEHNK